jgi:SAM-dependent methyltransferase
VHKKPNLFWDAKAKEFRISNRMISKAALLYYKCIDDIVNKFSIPLRILKTDLWNEGIEPIGKQKEKSIKEHSGIEVFGIDISRCVCVEAHKRCGQMRVVKADIRAIPFRDKIFDTVLDLSTSDHLNPAEIPICLKEYRRILKKGGRLIMVFNNYSLFSIIRKNIDPHKFRWAFKKNLVKKVFGTYFGIVFERSLDTFQWFPFSNRITQRLSPLLKLFEILERSALSRKLSVFSQSYILVGIPQCSL